MLVPPGKQHLGDLRSAWAGVTGGQLCLGNLSKSKVERPWAASHAAGGCGLGEARGPCWDFQNQHHPLGQAWGPPWLLEGQTPFLLVPRSMT